MPQYVRVYNNPNVPYHREHLLNAREAEDQVRYDARFRFGVAVFIDGVCRQTGYLTKDRCDKISEELKQK